MIYAFFIHADGLAAEASVFASGPETVLLLALNIFVYLFLAKIHIRYNLLD